VGVSDLEVKRLQRIHNFLAQVVLYVPLRTCSSVLLHQLYWLPVEFRIKFRLTCLTYKALNTSKPTYLHALLTPYTPPRCLRSSFTRLLAEPRDRTVMTLWALVHSLSLPPRNGIDFHSLFVAQTLYPPSKSGSKLTIFLGFQRIRKLIGSSPGG